VSNDGFIVRRALCRRIIVHEPRALRGSPVHERNSAGFTRRDSFMHWHHTLHIRARAPSAALFESLSRCGWHAPCS
jgi:hypothetical protein